MKKWIIALSVAVVILAIGGLVVWLNWPDVKAQRAEVLLKASTDLAALEAKKEEEVQAAKQQTADFKAKVDEFEAAKNAELVQIKAALAEKEAALEAAKKASLVLTNRIVEATLKLEAKPAGWVEGDTELNPDSFAKLTWREGASKQHGHIIFSQPPLVGKDLESSWHLFAPILAEYYNLRPFIKTKDGRETWALVPLKKSIEVPKKVRDFYRTTKAEINPNIKI